MLDGPVEIFRLKTQAGQDLFGAVFKFINAQGLELLQHIAVAVGRGLIFVFEFAFLPAQGLDPVVPFGQFLHDGAFGFEFRLLREISDIDAFLDLDLAGEGLALAADNGKQRGLPCPVGSGQTDLFIRKNAEGDVLEQRPLGEAHGEIIDGDHVSRFA